MLQENRRCRKETRTSRTIGFVVFVLKKAAWAFGACTCCEWNARVLVMCFCERTLWEMCARSSSVSMGLSNCTWISRQRGDGLRSGWVPMNVSRTVRGWAVQGPGAGNALRAVGFLWARPFWLHNFVNIWQESTRGKFYPNQTLFIPLESSWNMHI